MKLITSTGGLLNKKVILLNDHTSTNLVKTLRRKKIGMVVACHAIPKIQYTKHYYGGCLPHVKHKFKKA